MIEKMLEEYQEIRKCLESLDGHLDDMKATGCQHAKNERDYRVLLRTAELHERVNNKVPASMISDVSRGREDVADMKCSRDCSEVLYKAAQEAINIEKLKIRVLNDAINRDYNSGGMSNA